MPGAETGAADADAGSPTTAGPVRGSTTVTAVRGRRSVGRRGRSRPATRRGEGLVQWFAVIVVALLAAALLKTYVVEAFAIPSGSMETTIMTGDRVLVDKLSYDFGHHPHSGDIVVFAKPPGFEDRNISDLIKRVIATPGESVRSAADGSIFVDGRLLSQPWLDANARTNPGPAICSYSRRDCVGRTLHLPAGMYLVMGDNRDDSSDGRIFGPITGSSIVGRAFVRFWPLTHLHILGSL